MGIQSLLISIAKPVVSVVFGGVILWQVAEHCGSMKGRAIVHVPIPKVELIVDDVPYRVESLYGFADRLADLAPGRHVVQMHRDGRVLYREEFTLGRGEEVILSAWDGYTDGRSPGQDEREGLER